MLTNLLFVFGLSCLIGGLRFQVQELRIVSGNASIGMLMLAVAGLALPAALMLSDEMVMKSEEKEYMDKNGDGKSDISDGPTFAMVGFSRFNAAIMIVGYLLYLLFQLGSHKDEFEDLEEEEEGGDSNLNGTSNGSDNVGQGQSLQRNNAQKTKKKARKNKFCTRLLRGGRGEDDENGDARAGYQYLNRLASIREMELSPRGTTNGNNVSQHSRSQSLPDHVRKNPGPGDQNDIPQSRSDIGVTINGGDDAEDEADTIHMSNVSSRRRTGLLTKREQDAEQQSVTWNAPKRSSTSNKSHCSDGSVDEEPYLMAADLRDQGNEEETHMSFRAGLFWLFIITLSISAMSDILVDTIDGFAYRMHISEVFTSLVILPYFSNIAEQVSALIFAYRNEMDLCVGITVGSAVQIALFVLPGSVLIGWAMDRSMSLFFRGFETCCLIFSVVSVAAVLQGGTTNWLVGAYLLGVYFMIAAGFWFHEMENLSIDGELLNLHNHTRLH